MANEQISVPRSGDQVITTMAIVMPVVALLSPFFAAGIAWMGANTLLVFPDGYQKQLESTLGSGIALGIAWLRMRAIRKAKPDTTTTISKPDETSIRMIDMGKV